MVWHGRPQEESNKLPPGDHIVRLERVVDLDSGDFLAVLSNQDGECAININPDLSDRKHSWRFWRLCGAFDYPSRGYWETAPDQREERDWEPGEDLVRISNAGTQCAITVTEKLYQGKKYANVDEMRSLTKAPPAARVLDEQIPF